MTVGRVAVEPVTLDFNGVRLEPLSLDHVDGLRAAAADGQLWNIRVTSVPEPNGVTGSSAVSERFSDARASASRTSGRAGSSPPETSVPEGRRTTRPSP